MATLRYAARFVNRNPRNLEAFGLQHAPKGFELEADKDIRSFIYKVELVQAKSHQEARLTHCTNGVVIKASTKEKTISDQLYSNSDTCASMNLARILATRCLQAGIHYVMPDCTDEQLKNSRHQAEFFNVLNNDGLEMKEPKALEQLYETDRSMTWQRYSSMTTRQEKLDEL
ncbi:hypothetical protein Q1695_016447 [Nippostrongylus brasiliensis]|nr:hypothetical protein Q1695_016447 [Nippostrongylus brasiliensis]